LIITQGSPTPTAQFFVKKKRISVLLLGSFHSRVKFDSYRTMKR